jgi:hypothetical protein
MEAKSAHFYLLEQENPLGLVKELSLGGYSSGVRGLTDPLVCGD